MRARLASAAVAAACVLLPLTGCGAAEQLTHKLDLKQASSWIGDATALRVTLTVQAAPGDVTALLGAPSAAATGSPSAAVIGAPYPEALTRTELELVGSPKDQDAASATAVRIDGTEAVRLVTGADRVYARVDAASLRRLAPTGSTLAAVDPAVDPAVLAPMLDLLVPGTGALVRGDWVTTDRGALDAVLARLAGRPVDSGRPVFATVMSRFERLVRKARIVPDDQDPDHEVLELRGGDVSDALAGLGEPAAAATSSRPSARSAVDAWRARLSVPATVRLDAYFRAGDLDRLSVDLTQFLDRAGGGPVRLVVGLAEAPAVTPPAEAAELDLVRLAARFPAVLRAAGAGRAEPGG